MDDFETNLIGMLKSNQDQDVEDEYEFFCKSLAPKLRRISHLNQRKGSEVQFNINKLIFEAEQEIL